MKSTNGESIKDKLYRKHDCLGKHKVTNSIISDGLASTPSSKLSKLVFATSKHNTKPSLISLVSKTHSRNKTVSIKEEKGKPLQIRSDLKSEYCSRKPVKDDVFVVPKMQEVLKKSFLKRGKLTTKSGIKDIKEVGIPLSDNVTEWSVSSNDMLCHSLNPISTITDITPHKIVKPMVKSYRGNVDLSWGNPVIGGGNQSGIPSVAAKDKKLQKCDKVYSSCSFTIDMLKRVQVIGSVDDKFIACLLHVNKGEEMLVLVDQHAAHERIRLEKLLNQVGYYSNEKKKKINGQRTQLSPPANLSIYENEVSMLVHYKKEFNNVGLNFSFVRSTTSSFHRVFVSSVPAIFVNGYELQLEARGSVVNTEFLKEFIREQIKYMQSTGCPCNMSSRTIFQALASYACHGAIKFGDKISLSTCKKIMEDLATCDLPFQCAHGRPTIVPIFKLNFLDGILNKPFEKPNLIKLRSLKM